MYDFKNFFFFSFLFLSVLVNGINYRAYKRVTIQCKFTFKYLTLFHTTELCEVCSFNNDKTINNI